MTTQTNGAAPDSDSEECAYCGRDIPLATSKEVPAASDDDRWAEIAKDHAGDCEWVATRAHRRDSDSAE